AAAGPARVYRNVAPARGGWLSVRCLEPCRRDALGAEVTVRAGRRLWVRTAQAGGSYLSSSDPRAHFGLGGLAKVDCVEVAWPGGTKERFPGGPPNRHLTLVRGRGTPLR